VELAGKVAVVTGGAVRIGRALALALADAGASVVIHYFHSEDEARATVDEISARGGRAKMVANNLAEPVSSARTIFQGAADAFGEVDILVNSAAIFDRGTLASTTEADWDRHFNINLKAPFFLCREFNARRTPGRPGNIVNVVDWRALRPVTGHLAYNLAKSALAMLTQILALELAPEVRVNAVAPGAILPPPGADANFMERLAQQIPLRRTGTTDDVTSAVLYLLRSEFITGEVLCVSGGQNLA
jgi:pteridine reductase